ncbi:hypothetical protein LOK49_LG08G01858 [Camellia lanceoleosa]|uniref:Uncharacterized protein n=1 Tax=Camellia lanceoleosa TaxID=1840588 RepID=A0ACC0GXJ2_9ERIC|nr:hypothetical protein LOK49_LG08G01858 [Camellia lanceoleosa]
MEGQPSEFHDWEMLNNSDERSSVNLFDSVETMKSLEGIEADSEGMIRTDYFSLDSHNKYVKTVSEEGSIESDNPSWIDPESETRYPRKEPGEFWPDSGSDKSDDLKFNEFDANNELGFVENEKIHLGFEGIGEIGPISMEFGDFEHDNNANSESAGEKGLSSGNESDAIGAMKSSGGEEEKRSVVWWKLPFEFFKYCAFKVNPVWTFSVAAAVIGVVVLGRQLLKMKKKNQSLQLKVTMDDKKVSQFMTRAARLNEAFSVMKQVPVIRPSLPAVGATPWPVMSLR